MIRSIPLLLLLASCWPYAPDQVPTGSACVLAADDEVCVEDLDVQEVDGTVEIRGQATVSGVELGFEQTELELVLVPEGEGWTVERGVLPAVVTCELDIAHGDHCHLGVPSVRACTLPLDASDVQAVVDDSQGSDVSLRFRATSPVDAPDCCQHTCSDSQRTPTADPPGPYKVVGAVRVELGG